MIRVINKDKIYKVYKCELKQVKYGNKLINRHIINDNIKIGLNWYIEYICPSCQLIIKKRYDHYLKNQKCKKCTILEKYGVEYITQSKKIKNKSKQTKLEKYGNENYNNKNKSKQTKLEKYENENYNNKEKIKQTKLEKYGNENYNNKEKIKQTQYTKYGSYGFNTQKQKNTVLKKYQVEHIFQSKEIKEKIKQTKLEKYGNENYNNIEQIKKTNLKKYKFQYYLENRDVITKSKQRNFYARLNKRTNRLLTPLFTLNDYKGVNNKYQWLCNKCGTVFWGHLDDGRIPRCPTCYPYSKSLGEQKLLNYCKFLELNIIENDRTIIKPYEIDIYLPDYKLAIEYNGLYWHNIDHVDKWYHQRKVELAYRKGIRLLHVWEYEDMEQVKEIIQYYINNVDEYIEVKKPKLYNIENNFIWI